MGHERDMKGAFEGVFQANNGVHIKAHPEPLSWDLLRQS